MGVQFFFFFFFLTGHEIVLDPNQLAMTLDLPGKHRKRENQYQVYIIKYRSATYGTSYDQIFNIQNIRCNLTENDSTLFETMQHGENAPTCIRQYHLAIYRRMLVGEYLRVHVDAFLPFTSVAF